MKIGIVGLPLSGKTSLFTALISDSFKREEHPQEKFTIYLGSIRLEDPRLLHLAQVFGSKKITFSEITLLDLDLYEKGKKWFELSVLRDVDSFVGVVKCFDYSELSPFDFLKDMEAIEEEFFLRDLETIQKRREKIEQDIKKGKREEEKEFEILDKLKDFLEKNKALRDISLDAGEEKLVRGFKFLTQKPLFFVINLDERLGWESIEKIKDVLIQKKSNFILASLRLEKELKEMEEKDRHEFLESFGFKESLKERFISACFAFLGLVTFFTVKGEEAKAWLIDKNTTALKAAGKIHSEMEKGFIKAEVINYSDFLKAGSSLMQARKEGFVRLEAKEYVVKDGDIIDFRFAI